MRGEKLWTSEISLLRSLLNTSKNPEPHRLSECRSEIAFSNRR